jgi:methionyl-tRNA synthetase
MPKRHLITCALPYANGPLHIGHIAGCFLPADLHQRFLRFLGKEILFVCGTDEHGVPITLKAKKENKTPQQVVDENYELISKTLTQFEIKFDNFGRTSRLIHHKTSQDFFKNLYDKGIFVEQTTQQFFDESTQQFLADRYIVGTCPKCGYEEAYGDQCEKCGRSSNPNELINPKSALSGNTPILKETTNWFLPLDQLQTDFLEEWVKSKKGIWKNSVWGQCNSWLQDGLKPRAMTRDLDWGVPVPIENVTGKVMYVWFDAPIGYITSTKEAVGEDWQKWWMDENTELTHFLGKDNIVFHTIIFPAMLHAHGDFILPTNVPANEFLNLEGQKISTSRNHAIWLHEFLEEFPDKKDELRYALTSILPETKDADFTWKDFQARVNNELVAILGNFVNRVWILMHKYYDGKIPFFLGDESVVNSVKQISQQIEQHLSKFEQRQAFDAFMEIARLGNKYLQDQEPWKLIKDPENAQEVADCMGTCLAVVREIGRYAQIFLPSTADKILEMLSMSNWTEQITAGLVLGSPKLLYAKIEDEMIEQQIAKLESKNKEGSFVDFVAVKPEITYDDFAKMDLRTGIILEAEKVPKADKLLKFLVDIGLEKRIIVSGIAEHFSPETLIGKKVMVLANLAPRKLRGIESQGMILLAENAAKQLVFVSPDEESQPGDTIS